ncbi:MAG: tRNA uridine-5-carboxymethylaminomethyl(34) synthesis GTPase MnmE [Bacteroidetes bacterium]|nr:tRNA uridine-5-carboxymethylaminomethyl(34) synthesis GTPase MnmE [Bacteroidota bacterium]
MPQGGATNGKKNVNDTIHSQDMTDTIVAISTPQGLGAIGMIRLSGPDAISIADRVFSKNIAEAKGYTLHFGQFLANGKTLDEVLLTVFRGPRSFTREDVVEISFHGSPFILREALGTLLTNGARLATAGEFTQRAYLNGAMDLAQAEAVADLIASSNAQNHALAMHQMRGGISRELQTLRGRLLDFTSLLELELDFAEEDVEFADRLQFDQLLGEMLHRIAGLIRSFSFGNAVREGVPTTIVGKPNAGKSTLLNQLLQDNRAIVSATAGTTRDMIEERLVIDGIEFRLQDTAGIRETVDEIEAEGVQRSIGLAQKASLVIYLFDPAEEGPGDVETAISQLLLPESTHILRVANKADQFLDQNLQNLQDFQKQNLQNHIGVVNSRAGGEMSGLEGKDDIAAVDVLRISAKTGFQVDLLKEAMVASVRSYWEGSQNPEATIISNARHLHALRQTYESLISAREAMGIGMSGDLVSIDIRAALYHMGSITGEISTDEILGNIFGKFCIGK